MLRKQQMRLLTNKITNHKNHFLRNMSLSQKSYSVSYFKVTLLLLFRQILELNTQKKQFHNDKYINIYMYVHDVTKNFIVLIYRKPASFDVFVLISFKIFIHTSEAIEFLKKL